MLHPCTYGRSHPREQGAEDTPQRRQLVVAVLRREQLDIEPLLEAGYPPARFRERIERCNSGQVGAIVPSIVNEYVAYVPDRPEHALVLIPHPPLAGPGFWTRMRSQGMRGASYPARSQSRTHKYARLGQVLPVIAVFADQAIASRYTDLLRTSRLQWVAVQDISRRLRSLQCEGQAHQTRMCKKVL
ncbi:MAG: hypothetical protein ABI670_20420 [Chloroflexota bacterium]